MKLVFFLVALACSSAMAQEATGRDKMIQQWDAESAAAKQRTFDKSTVGKRAMVASRKGVVEQSVSRADFIYILYDGLKCPIDVAGAEKMRRAEVMLGKGMAGACWGKTLKPTGDEIVILDQWGNLQTASLTQFYTGIVQKDGSVAVSGRAMSFDQVTDNIKRYHDSLR
ncbi:hypothetical protein HUS70_07375 [Pandoraea nosoerga]|uniref:hypothetical protein n=1 Tax=Pandoraea nosoerga TaxID=2508296 RepID=UPI00197E6BAE|nr:hypothetical protein [Pandoraea nosoerga]MBN4665444.1 hypothetical protein [Pandoraea nosoerga]MBN4674969.1 hypothetical protein [Pandoraea nosoerga]MBN4680285.1 hypothetical protein [Pandoraea nosoerga]MBN4744482.1 hypothetical protein [Pandoraea nosoerga]